MDWHEYVTGRLVQHTVTELRAAAARERLYQAYRPARRPVRLALGHALIRLGSRLTGAEAPSRHTNLRHA